MHFLAGVVAMAAQSMQRLHIPVQLPLDVEGIKAVLEIVHALRCADLHIDGSTDLQAGKILPEEPSDHR